jgi:predicted Zn-dependent peptidase
MANLARQEMYFGRFFSLDELIENIERVTVEDIQRISRAFFDPKQIALTVLGSLSGFRVGRRDLSC